MRNTPLYAAVWSAAVIFGLSGLSRFLAIFGDLISIENDSYGYRLLFTSGVLLVHAAYVLVLVVAAILHPRRPAFSSLGISGSVVACGFVILGLAVYQMTVDRKYSIAIQFIDSAGVKIPKLPVVVKHKIAGFTPATSPERTHTSVLENGFLSVNKSIRETLTVSASFPGLTHVEVEVPPMGAPYHPGPLQMVSMSWFIDPKRRDKNTSANGAMNWDFAKGTLIVPVPPAQPPVTRPIPDFTEDDLRALKQK